MQFSDIVSALYRGIHDRDPDAGGFAHYVKELNSGASLAYVVRSFINSNEFRCKHPTIPNRSEIYLPDLLKMYPAKYSRIGHDFALFEANSDDDFYLLESLITKYRYCDSIEAYSPTIDLDKRITASIVEGLGAKSVMELGCFTGSVISILAEHGIDVCGVDASHLALVLSYSNVRDKLRFGDLLNLTFDTSYDVLLAMDVLEHLNPLKINKYIERIKALLKPHGFVYVNSPMFGEDRNFGSVFKVKFPEWIKAGEASFWRHIYCDLRGWPMHGHLICASPKWWEKLFRKHGLIRDQNIELCIHTILKDFFDNAGSARRSLFALRHEEHVPDYGQITKSLSDKISPVVSKLGY